MSFAPFFAVAKLYFGAMLTEEVLWVHVLADGAIIVILAAIVNFAAVIAVVESHLLGHEFEWRSLLFFRGLLGQAVLFVNPEGCLRDLNLLQQSDLHQ